MKIKLFFTLAFMIVSTYLLVAQTNFQLKDNKISIHGTSNIHDWESVVTQVSAEGKVEMENGRLKTILALNVTIAVEGIKSAKGSVMDKKTYKALRSETHPNIIFELKKVGEIKSSEGKQTLQANGNLTIAGSTKKIDLEVVAERVANGNFRFTGSKDLKMTHFNIEPPTALFGSLKTGDDVTIKFDIVLTPIKNATSLSSKE